MTEPCSGTSRHNNTRTRTSNSGDGNDDDSAHSLTAARIPIWRWPLAYATTAVVFLGLDATWLSTAASALYQPAIGHLMAPSVDVTAAMVFYPLYIAGLVFFAEAPAVLRGQAREGWWRGVLLGVLAYATYDLTNQATLRDWPWKITLIDLVWGGFASGAAAWAATALTLFTCRRVNRTTGR